MTTKAISKKMFPGSPSPSGGRRRWGAVALAVGHWRTAQASVSPLQPPPAGGGQEQSPGTKDTEVGCSLCRNRLSCAPGCRTYDTRLENAAVLALAGVPARGCFEFLCRAPRKNQSRPWLSRVASTLSQLAKLVAGGCGGVVCRATALYRGTGRDACALLSGAVASGRLEAVQSPADLPLLPRLDKQALRQNEQAFLIEGLDRQALWMEKTSGTTGTALQIYRPHSHATEVVGLV